jgi:tricorn protease
MKRLWILLFFLLGATTPGHAEEQEPTLFRQPTVSRTHIVFSYAGDLWIVSRAGGEAKRLTSGPGEDTNPVFSPDGNLVAFSRESGSGAHVYVVPAAGGEPRRLTYHPGWYWSGAVGWTPDGKSVVFAYWGNAIRLFSVPSEGGPATELPPPSAAYGAFSPDGKRIAYAPFVSYHRNRKRYRGGRTSRIWIADLPDCRIEKIPRGNSNDFNPMWVDNRVYFLSDRNGPISLFAYDVETKKVLQIIHNPATDILSASAGPGAIVYERFGSVHLYDLEAGKSRQLAIRVSGEMPEMKPRSVNASDNLTGVRLSPAGDRALIEARGELLTVPALQGEIQNLTNTPGVRERFPVWSPDGKRIAYFSDESGEYALHVRNSDGTSVVKKIDLVQLPGFYFSPVWSPDSKKIAYRDHRLCLWYVDVEKGSPVRIDSDAYQERIWVRIEAPPPAWSPDSRWLSYTKMLENHMRALHIYSLETGQSQQVTDGLSDISSPQFDRSGNYLYFGASTDIGPTQGDDLSAWDRTPSRSVYVAFLRNGLKFPTTPEGKAAGPVVIDFDRLADRIVALPIPARNYTRLVAGEPGALFLLETVPQPQHSLPGSDPSSNPQTLYRFELGARKTDKVIEGIRDFDLSGDGQKMLCRQGRKWAISPVAVPLKSDEGALKLESLQVRINPAAEWKQMFHEVWRSIRDLFYDPGFHGLNLKAREEEFEPYLKSVASPADLNYLFREMLSELRVSHLNVMVGMEPQMKTSNPGLLGADYEVADGRYRLARIYAADTWNPQARAPLRQPGLDLKEGDYLLAVDGHELRATDNIYCLFEGKAGKEVVLRVAPDAAGGRPREVTVVPIDDEYVLRQFAWVEDNRRRVDRLTSGRVAYIYLPDASKAGLAVFDRYFFAQADKEAVIVDARSNSGGALPEYFVHLLGRQVLALVATRAGQDFTAPYSVIRGPKVMIADEFTWSAGDCLAWFFKRLGLGPLIGSRTGGGMVGIGGRLTLLNGGWLSVSSNAVYGPDGKWAPENEGVAPDIEVEQDPAAVRAGRDPQLEKAVEVILTLLKKNPPSAVKKPPYKRLQ